ncbi:MAG TPA: rhomboid family intramembrane serine protease [Planctomycetota bacterium]|nr:rhomboid family intramembrane serine protease [Planctomycetota bacterium]
MFLPIGDDNPRERVPVVTLGLIGLNLVLFYLWCLEEPVLVENISVHALFPNQVDWTNAEWWKDIFSSMFMHANLLHILGNMLFLWIFGDNVEDKLGHFMYLVFYLVCGVSAAVLHVYTTANPDIPTLGASGAVSGVLGAYVLFFPVHNVKMLVFPFGVMPTPAYLWIGVWFVEQLLFARMERTGVAWYAHIGGFIAGVGMALPARVLLRKRFARRARNE